MQEIELQEVTQTEGAGANLVNRDAALLEGVQVPLTVQIGSTSMSASDLFALKAGQVIKLDEMVNEPIKLMLDQKPIAHGKLVVSDDCFAIEITELS